ncbi:hypothetical protein Droror1_Dr00012267 [Drosera rotundifolia]
MKSTAHSSSLTFSSLYSRRHPLSISHRRRPALPHRSHRHAAPSSQLARSPSLEAVTPFPKIPADSEVYWVIELWNAITLRRSSQLVIQDVGGSEVSWNHRDK